MTTVEYINCILGSILIVNFIWFIVGSLFVWQYERKILILKEKINNLPKEIKEKVQNHLMIQQQFERLVKKEQDPLLEELKTLEKKRRFILDKLPFIKDKLPFIK